MALHSGALRPVRVKAKRLASIRLCQECCPLTSKDVQGSANAASLWKERGVIFSQFWGSSFSWLERLPVTQEVAGSSPVAPANFTKRNTHRVMSTHF
jgi:hypothetical protein